MRYLKKYNEARYNARINDELCKSLSGYTSDELQDIFKLNLEDNDKFDLLDVAVFIESEGDSESVAIELSEYYGDNYDFTNMNTRSVRRSIRDINTLLLNRIAMKYDLVTFDWDDWGTVTNHNIKFSVRKK